MAGQTGPLWLILTSVICALFISYYIRSSDGDQQVYIVYMGACPKGDIAASFLHARMLEEIVGSSRASESLLYSYKRSFNGFVAKLTKEEKDKIGRMEGVVSVFPNKKMELQTTRSWDFMGFPQDVTRRTQVESNIIIGVLDTGIWPESKIFDDFGFGPPPSKWNGYCESSVDFTCNNKIIGAKYYYTGPGAPTLPDNNYHSPRDIEGHGTHTASIAAGGLVTDASLLGLGMGTARGGVPSARIAVYKICWYNAGCSDADILAAFDDAIADGVDIISVSVGTPIRKDYFQDPFAIGAFHAMKKGIVTSSSADNYGPNPGSITKVAPWILSVAASTIDRKLLGNNMYYEGVSVNTFELDKPYPLVYAADVPNTGAGYTGSQSWYCNISGVLDPTLVNGKIVICEAINNGSVQLHAGAIGTITGLGSVLGYGEAYPLPTSDLKKNDNDVYTYIKSTSLPTATIMRSREITDDYAPYVIPISSRGPNPVTVDILKPDLASLGVEILAAWSEGTTVTGIEGDTRVVPYNIITGTSMACPHATGAAAYVKSFNLNARPISRFTNLDTEFAYGAGNIDPVRTKSPSLLYDAVELDYVRFLCGQGYSDNMMHHVTGDNIKCNDVTPIDGRDLNYPSFALSVRSEYAVTHDFQRTITNVGSPTSISKQNCNLLPFQDLRSVLNRISLFSTH